MQLSCPVQYFITSTCVLNEENAFIKPHLKCVVSESVKCPTIWRLDQYQKTHISTWLMLVKQNN